MLSRFIRFIAIGGCWAGLVLGSPATLRQVRCAVVALIDLRFDSILLLVIGRSSGGARTDGRLNGLWHLWGILCSVGFRLVRRRVSRIMYTSSLGMKFFEIIVNAYG